MPTIHTRVVRTDPSSCGSPPSIERACAWSRSFRKHPPCLDIESPPIELAIREGRGRAVTTAVFALSFAHKR
ncbi:uncharacterized protein EI90DRAFT_3031366 [Cantharellus anzutake]|uniref:uncharacterized protein n=1 Tax=Cantharellus anzutake TaxID=1750568 RepID=UPI0019063FC4|nr:uncharacterized protein EI90DRAFT_3031366 [Cantharellus anzutake]KAF8343103.1 hypothetical protein EI90DRAFT_3031366 [Cantharellus anzutake]